MPLHPSVINSVQQGLIPKWPVKGLLMLTHTPEKRSHARLGGCKKPLRIDRGLVVDPSLSQLLMLRHSMHKMRSPIQHSDSCRKLLQSIQETLAIAILNQPGLLQLPKQLARKSLRAATLLDSRGEPANNTAPQGSAAPSPEHLSLALHRQRAPLNGNAHAPALCGPIN